MKIGVRARFREANTLYRHPNHLIFCHLVGASTIYSFRVTSTSTLSLLRIHTYMYDTESGLTLVFF